MVAQRNITVEMEEDELSKWLSPETEEISFTEDLSFEELSSLENSYQIDPQILTEYEMQF